MRCTRTWLGLACLPCLLLAPRSASAAGAALAWDPVTTNTDGTPATTLAGYKVYYGLNAAPPYDGTGALEGPSPITIAVTSLPDAGKPELKSRCRAACTTTSS